MANLNQYVMGLFDRLREKNRTKFGLKVFVIESSE